MGVPQCLAEEIVDGDLTSHLMRRVSQVENPLDVMIGHCQLGPVDSLGQAGRTDLVCFRLEIGGNARAVPLDFIRT